MKITFEGTRAEIEAAEDAAETTCYFGSMFCGRWTCNGCHKKYPQKKEFIIVEEKETK